MLYYLITFLESLLAIFGIRALEQSPYHVVTVLDRGVEIRDYGARVVVETDDSQGKDQAFGRLFRYITGANAGGQKIAMTAPVQQTGMRIAMTVPVETSGGRSGTMRFFLPASLSAASAPAPTDPQVRVVAIAPQTMAALGFSGTITAARLADEGRILLDVLTKAGRTPQGPPVLLGYDPPFTIPFLRRNEVAVPL